MIIESGDINSIRKLLNKGVDPNFMLNGVPLLGLAIKYQNKPIIKLLLEKGASPNKAYDYDVPGKETTILIEAIDTSNIDIVKSVIDHGADPNHRLYYTNMFAKKYPLIIAIKNDELDIFKLLVDKGADINFIDNNGSSLLYNAIKYKSNDIIPFLLEKGVDPNIYTGYFPGEYETPLMTATNTLNIDIVESLLNFGADPKDPIYYHPLRIMNYPLNLAIPANSLFTIINVNKLHIFKLLVSKGADINFIDDNGCSVLYNAAKSGNEEIVTFILENTNILNPPLSIRLPHKQIIRKTIEELAKNNEFNSDINEIIINHFSNEPIVEKKWKGWTRSDSEKLDTIFDEEANNYACCPVCLKYIARSDGCMYMSHNCKNLGGFYHKELYTKYYNRNNGNIDWCTICGRIAANGPHRHYKLGKSNEAKPLLNNPGNPFDKDCRLTNGGGGLPEKLARFSRMRDFAKELQNQVGIIDEKEVMTRLVEEVWNAPLEYPKNNTNITKKKFNSAHTNFPANAVVSNEVVASVAVRNFPRPAPNRNNPDLQPIVHPVGMNQIMQDEEAENVIQFRHRKKDGTINEHLDTWISKDSLEQIINWRIKNFGDESAISCWEYPKCDALMYPEEIKGLVPDELYENYKTMFSQQMAAREGGQVGGRIQIQKGGQQENFFKEATNATCAIGKRVPKGGRRKSTHKHRTKRYRITRKRRV